VRGNADARLRSRPRKASGLVPPDRLDHCFPAHTDLRAEFPCLEPPHNSCWLTFGDLVA
jgi:hypothetical protein